MQLGGGFDDTSRRHDPVPTSRTRDFNEELEKTRGAASCLSNSTGGVLRSEGVVKDSGDQAVVARARWRKVLADRLDDGWC